MTKAAVFTHSNARVFLSMAVEAHSEMLRIDSTNVKPHPTNPDGKVITYDPLQHSFKEALTAIVFAGVYIEAILHLSLAQRLGVKQAKALDRATYEGKLRALSIGNEALYAECKRYAELRRGIVHEKAHLDRGSRYLAQAEATRSIRLVKLINHLLGISHNTATLPSNKRLTGRSSGRQPTSRVGALRASRSGAAYLGR